MVDDRSGPAAIPLARYPDPVCVFDREAGTPVVQRVNSAFETAFDTVETGATVPEAFEAVGLTVLDAPSLARALGSGEPFSVTTPAAATAQYHVRVLRPTDGESGYLVFVKTADEQFGVDNVASVLSHELRNPLDVAKTRLRAGRELGEDDHFDNVAQAHERMERIIQDVLTLTRGQDVVDPDETVTLETLAEAAWDTVETGTATLTVEGPLPVTCADPDRVARLFENLFRNAVEHGTASGRANADASDGPISVRVGPLETDETAGFSVADDGVGIPAGVRERVFDPGYSSDEHGTGLGLAIVARIADLHGWSCSVTEADSGGARIEVRGVEPVADPEST